MAQKCSQTFFFFKKKVENFKINSFSDYLDGRIYFYNKFYFKIS